MAFINYTERPILALGLAGEAGAGLIWVDFNLVMPQQAPIRWSLNSLAAQANHGHPSIQYSLTSNVGHHDLANLVCSALAHLSDEMVTITWLTL